MFGFMIVVMVSMVVIVIILVVWLMMRFMSFFMFFMMGFMVVIEVSMMILDVASVTSEFAMMFIVVNMSIMIVSRFVSVDVSWTVFIMVCFLAVVVKICFPVSVLLVLSCMVGVFIDRSEVIVSMSFEMVNNWVLSFMVFFNFMGLHLILFHQ